MRLLLFTRSLDSGGAERQLTMLARALHERGVFVAVMVFYGKGPYRAILDEAGVEVIDLEKTGRWDVAGCLWRAFCQIRAYRPDLIYCFIGTGMIAALLKPFFRRVKLVWSVRASDVDFSHYDWFSRLFDKASAPFSRYADAVICNSEAGRRHIISQGFRSRAVSVVPNGFDVGQFRFDLFSRTRLRKAWGCADGDRLVGLVARLDPIKDHRSFIAASAYALVEKPELRFVCVGGGEAGAQAALQAQAETLGVADRLIWAGHCSDLAAIYSALDLLVLSSTSEAFPNVIGEGMSCGLPVVATDVGDCRAIVASHGWIVPPRDHVALAEGIIAATAALDDWNRDLPRHHIAEHYSVEMMVTATITVLEQTQAA